MSCYGKLKGSHNLDGHRVGAAHLDPGNRRDAFSPFRYYMRKARNRPKETDLDLLYLKTLWEQQKGRCALSGIKMEIPQNTRAFEKRGHDPWKPSLDRIDCSKGYLKGNVRFVTMLANFALNGFSDEDLVQFCQAVVAYQEHCNCGNNPVP